jgi:Family of unknown function (DUF6262)
MSLSRKERIARLLEATRQRQQAARDRAERGIKELTRAGEPVNYRSVARRGAVSIDFLYSDPDLRARIARLRELNQPSPATASPDPHSTVVLTLTAQLREARAEIARLKDALTAAHGENLALRRNQTTTTYRPAQ